MIKRLPWLRRLKKTQPEPPVRLPIACGPMSNGEGWWPDSPRKALIRKLVLEKADEVSRREGVDRREFLASACGMATTLYMINSLNGCAQVRHRTDNRPSTSAGSSGATGASAGAGGFDIPESAMRDAGMACSVLAGDEFIIDMQVHFTAFESTMVALPRWPLSPSSDERFPWIQRTPGCQPNTTCVNRDEVLHQVILGSDTTVTVLSGISYSVGAMGTGSGGFAALTNEQLLDAAHLFNGQFPRRVLSHCMVMPNDRLDVQLAMMERNAGSYDNWKTYTSWSPRANDGYWLHEGVGPMMIQKGLDLLSPIFCVHKGFPLSGFTTLYSSPRDIGPVANMFPEAHFVVFHSAFENGLASGESTMRNFYNPTADLGWGPGVGKWPEGPYDDTDQTIQKLYPLERGVNSLIKSLRDNNIGPNGKRLDGSSGPRTNVYAECGGVWPNLMLNRVEEGMHYWGKLLKHVGEDRILWGTDCVWFGSPQPVIEAFRAFEISQEFQEKYDYPALTAARKLKILGLNAMRLQNVRNGVNIDACDDDFARKAHADLRRGLDGEFGRRRDMVQPVAGPRTRREFMALCQAEHREKLALSGRVPRLI